MAIFRVWQHLGRSLKAHWQAWLVRRREQQLAALQARLQQQAWQNSLAERSHKADLAAGYNLAHFNTMQ